MSELPAGVARASAPEPEDSALGIVLRRAPDGRREVLLGQRSRRSRFLPGHLAFPGGRLEAADGPCSDGALARCATRELAEETGIEVAPGAWIDAGERVTPPIFPVRFRTRFFLTEVGDGAEPDADAPGASENERLLWADPGAVLGDWRAGRALVPPPLLPVLARVAALGPRDPAAIADAVREINAAEEDLPRIEFAPGIWVVPQATETLPPATHTNAWLAGAERFVVVDPGSSDPGEVDRLVRAVTRRVEEDGGEVAAIVLTHHHRDHVAGLAALRAVLDVPVLAHPETIARLPGAAAGGASPLDDGGTIDVIGRRLRAAHTPGHAPGHLALAFEAGEGTLAGDLVSGLSTILIDPHEGDMRAYVRSVERLERFGAGRLFPGHGPPLPRKAAEGTVAHRMAREAAIVEALRAGAGSLPSIAAAAYRDTPRAPTALAEAQTLAHLVALEREGSVRRLDAAGSSWNPC